MPDTPAACVNTEHAHLAPHPAGSRAFCTPPAEPCTEEQAQANAARHRLVRPSLSQAEAEAVLAVLNGDPAPAREVNGAFSKITSALMQARA